MATIIDALLVTVGLDASGMKQGATEAERVQTDIEKRANKAAEATKKQSTADSIAIKKKTAEERKQEKEREASLKRTSESIAKLRNEILGVTAAFLGFSALKDIATGLIQANSSLKGKSQTLGVEPVALAAWTATADKFNASAEDVENGLRNINAIQNSINTIGTDASITPLEVRLGIGPEFFQNTTSALEKIKMIREAAAKHTDVDTTQYLLTAGFSEGFARWVKAPEEAFQKELALQYKLNAGKKEQADEDQKLQAGWNRIKNEVDSLWNAILHDLAPAIQKATDWLTEFFESCKKHLPETEIAVGTLVTAFAGLSALSLASLIGGVASLTGGLGLAGAAATGLLIVFGDIAIAAAALTASITAGYEIAKWADEKLHPDKGGDATTTEKTDDAVRAAQPVQPFLPGKDVANIGKIIKLKLMGLGWSPNQAAGMTGSLLQESGGNPNAVNPASGAYGVAQWLGSRKEDFTLWAQKNAGGRSLANSTLDDQLAFMTYELREGKEQAAGRLIAGNNDPQKIAKIHSVFYERPGAAEANNSRRMALARGLADPSLRLGAGATAGAVSNSTKTSTSTSEVNVNGPISIHTAATDAPGIAAGIYHGLQSYAFASNANTGLN